MRTQLTILALFLGILIVSAQEPKKEMKVRVKKIEKINGVEKITDTVYITNDLSALEIPELDTRISNSKTHGTRKFNVVSGSEGPGEVFFRTKGDSGKMEVRKYIIHHNDAEKNDRIMILNSDRPLTAEEKIALEEAAVALRGADRQLDDVARALREADKHMQKINEELGLMEAENDSGIKASGDRKIERIIIIRELKTAELNKEDEELLARTTGVADNKLAMDEMKFFPNPNDGKFRLSFNLKEKGDTKIQIVNAEGKSVYNEQLLQFTGAYDRKLDISKYPKGVYFVRIEQNKHAQVKKIVLE